MFKRRPSPNDQRSNVKNPNNPAFKQAQDHRSVQLNPNDPHNAPAEREVRSELEPEPESESDSEATAR